MTNFDFLLADKQFSSFADVAVAAEKLLHIDVDSCVLSCRRAMEFAVKWMYSVDRDLSMPYQDNLNSLMGDESFRDIVGTDIWRRMDLIRRTANNAAHSGKKVTPEMAELCIRNLFVFMDFVACCYGDDYVEPTFDESFLKEGTPHPSAAPTPSPIGEGKNFLFFFLRFTPFYRLIW